MLNPTDLQLNMKRLLKFSFCKKRKSILVWLCLGTKKKSIKRYCRTRRDPIQTFISWIAWVSKQKLTLKMRDNHFKNIRYNPACVWSVNNVAEICWVLEPGMRKKINCANKNDFSHSRVHLESEMTTKVNIAWANLQRQQYLLISKPCLSLAVVINKL